MSQAKKIYDDTAAKDATVDAIGEALIASGSTRNTAQDPASTERRKNEARQVLAGDFALSDLHSQSLSPDEMLQRQRQERELKLRHAMPNFERTVTMRDPSSGWNVPVKESLLDDRLEQGFKYVDREGRAIIDDEMPKKDSSLELDQEAARKYFADQRRHLEEQREALRQEQDLFEAQKIQKPVEEQKPEGEQAQ